MAAGPAALHEAVEGASKNQLVVKSTQRLGEYLQSWHAGQRRRPSTTWSGDGKAVELITRRLGRVPLQALTAVQVEGFDAEPLGSGRRNGASLSPTTVKHSHTGLRKRWPTPSGSGW